MLKNITDIMNRIQEIQRRFGLTNQIQKKAPTLTDITKKVDSFQNQLQKQQVSAIKQKAEVISRRQGVSSHLVQSIIQNASAYNPSLVSRNNRMGLMQLLPDITKKLGMKNPLSINENLTAGISLLKGYLKKYDGDYVKALAAFNTGDKFDGKKLSPQVKHNIKDVLVTYKQNTLEKK